MAQETPICTQVAAPLGKKEDKVGKVSKEHQVLTVSTRHLPRREHLQDLQASEGSSERTNQRPKEVLKRGVSVGLESGSWRAWQGWCGEGLQTEEFKKLTYDQIYSFRVGHKPASAASLL